MNWSHIKEGNVGHVTGLWAEGNLSSAVLCFSASPFPSVLHKALMSLLLWGLKLQRAPTRSPRVSKHVNTDAFVRVAELQAIVQWVHQNENFRKQGSQKPPFVYSDRRDQWSAYRQWIQSKALLYMEGVCRILSGYVNLKPLLWTYQIVKDWWLINMCVLLKYSKLLNQ